MQGNLKQIAQNVLDTSYKLYSDISLINSSLFKAAYSLGVQLPEVPQISLSMTNEKTAQPVKQSGSILGRMHLGVTNEKTAQPLKSFDSTREKSSKTRSMPLAGVSTDVNIDELGTPSIHHPAMNLRKEEKAENLNDREQKINKVTSQLARAPASNTADSDTDNTNIGANKFRNEEKKVSLEEKENKLNALQGGRIKVDIKQNGEVIEESPFEEVSFEKQLSPQSNLQKKIFETTNFGRKNATEETSSISDNPLNRLLRLIKEKHSVTTTQAAQALNVSKDLIERWAKILNQSSLIRIKYQLVGDTILEG